MIPGATTSLDTAADTAAGVLAFARDRRAAADAAEVDLLRAACAWADLHPAESIGDAVRFGDTPVPVAGPGAPLVAEFCVAEFAAAVGLPTETGKAYLGEALELRHRLPKTWARVGPVTCRRGGPGGSPAPRSRSSPRRQGSWTTRSRGSRTGSAPAGWTGWWRRRSCGSCRPRPAAAGRPPTMAGTPTCTPTRCPSRAPCG